MKPIIVIVLSVLTIVSCSDTGKNSATEKTPTSISPKQAIVGKWKYKVAPEGAVIKGMYEYFEDGRIASSGTFESEDGQKVRCNFDFKGTYVLSDQTLSYLIDNVNVDCNPKELSKTLEDIIRDETGTDDIIELTDKVMVVRDRSENKIETTYIKISE